MPILSPNKTVTRIYSDEKNVQATAFPTSGFSQTYQSRYDGILGRMIPAGVHFIAPHDKYQGVNSGSITMEHIVTPNAPELQVHSYNFAGTFRSIDTGFEDLMSPSKLNNYSSTASLPIFTPSSVLVEVTKGIVFGGTASTLEVMTAAYRAMKASSSANAKAILDVLKLDGTNNLTSAAGWNAFINRASSAARTATIRTYMTTTYCADVIPDFDAWVEHTIHTVDFATASVDYRVMAETLFSYIYKFVSMFIGAGSNMDFLGYPVTNMRTVRNAPDISKASDLPYVLLYGQKAADCKELPCNEYLLRLLTTIWICYFRNIQLEPLNATLRWRKWGSASFLAQGYAHAEFWMLLTMRALPWSQDMVTSAMIDDIAEHVYAPVVTGTQSGVSYRYNTDASVVNPAASTASTTDIVHSTLQSVNLKYYDHLQNANVSISSVIPSSIGRFMSLANVSTEATNNSIAIDLRTLKQAGMLERFLHRCFYFGDQFSDSQKAFWMVDMSDATLFIPKLLSGGVSIIGQQQEVANSGTETTPQGTRTATMAGDIPSDPYSDFAEEFGAVINIVYVAPTVQYDPLLKQNLYRSYADFPNPVFAQDNESIMYTCEFSRTQANAMRPWGHVPYANEFRSRLNSVHGKFIDQYADWTINRFFGSDSGSIPNLNWATLHMSGMQLGCFDHNVLLDGQFYVLSTHKFNVERMLPAPVEYM